MLTKPVTWAYQVFLTIWTAQPLVTTCWILVPSTALTCPAYLVPCTRQTGKQEQVPDLPACNQPYPAKTLLQVLIIRMVWLTMKCLEYLAATRAAAVGIRIKSWITKWSKHRAFRDHQSNQIMWFSKSQGTINNNPAVPLASRHLERMVRLRSKWCSSKQCQPRT